MFASSPYLSYLSSDSRYIAMHAMSPHNGHPFVSAKSRANEAPGLDDPLRFSFGTRLAAPFGTVTEAFYHHAREHPGVIAARDLSAVSEREIDYATLARRSRRLAIRLRELGVRPGDRIPLVVKRSIEMLVGLLAILSCGAQYVPLDGGVVPDSALRFVLRQTGGRIALCLASTEYRVLNVTDDCNTVVIPVLNQQHPDAADLEQDDADFQDLTTPDHGCYVIYTSGAWPAPVPLETARSGSLTGHSGTTGTPKGVDVTHRNVTNIVCLAPGGLGITPGTRVGQVLNIGFDMGQLIHHFVISWSVKRHHSLLTLRQRRGKYWVPFATAARWSYGVPTGSRPFVKYVSPHRQLRE